MIPPWRNWSWKLVFELLGGVASVLAIAAFLGYADWRSIVNEWQRWTGDPPGQIGVQPPPGGDEPPRKPPDPPPDGWREPSDLAGQTWTFNFDGGDVQVAFGADGSASFSTGVFGDQARWKRQGRNNISIATTSHTFGGTMSTDREGMALTIQKHGAQEPIRYVQARRIGER